MDEFLERISPDRRRFIQRILGMATFAAPTVRTFVMATAAAAVPAIAQTTTGSTTTTHFPTTSMPMTTTAPHGGGVPEIDAGSAGTAISLLAGAVLIARDRLRSKEAHAPEKTEIDSENQP
ncbi:MAG TPA: hypothetical protein VI756_27770 [Blastocatellia bacterium]